MTVRCPCNKTTEIREQRLTWVHGPGVSTPPRGQDGEILVCQCGKLTMGCHHLTAVRRML